MEQAICDDESKLPKLIASRDKLVQLLEVVTDHDQRLEAQDLLDATQESIDALGASVASARTAAKALRQKLQKVGFVLPDPCGLWTGQDLKGISDEEYLLTQKFDRLIKRTPQVSGIAAAISPADKKVLETKLAKLINEIADLVSWKSAVSDLGMSQDGPCFWIGILRARRDAVKRQLAGLPALTAAQKEALAGKFGETFGISECDKFSNCGMIFELTGRNNCVYAGLSYPETALDTLVDAVRTLHEKQPEGALPLHERPEDIEAVGDAIDKLRAFYEEAGVEENASPVCPPTFRSSVSVFPPSLFKRAERFRNLRQNVPLPLITTLPPKMVPLPSELRY